MKQGLIFVLAIGLFFSCKVKNSGSQTDLSGPIIMKVGEQEVTTSEFKYIYNKNSSRSENAYSKESIDEYVDLFVKFKLKVIEAESQKLDTVPTFIKELEGYKKQLAKPYMTEKGLTEKLTKEVYDRLQEEVESQHILIKVEPEADPQDTLKAWNKINEIAGKIKEGGSFGTLAIEYSDDPSSKMEEAPLGYRGYLGYFSALSLVYEYENALYNTPVGKVSSPIRTKFGYHLVKVLNRRKSEGKVKVAHIMVRAADGLDTQDSIAAAKKAHEIYKEVSDGGDWNDLCSQYSEHSPSKNNGGELKEFRKGGLGIPTVEDAAFALTTAGDISSPVKSPYGWHIIKLISKIQLGTWEEEKEQLEKRVAKDGRSQLSQTALIKRLKSENNFAENQEIKKHLMSLGDSSLLNASWKPTTVKAQESLFTIDKTAYPLSGFLEFAQLKQRRRSKISPSYALELLYNDYVDKCVYDYEEKTLSDKYLDYKMLVKEYRDGILLFELMDNNVWTKAIEDTSGLRTFYNTNKNDYKMGERASATIYSLRDDSKLGQLKTAVASGMNNMDILTEFNQKSSLNLNIEEGEFEKGDNKIIDNLNSWSKGEYTLKEDNLSYLVVIKEILPKRIKKLSEARGMIISDYQNYLEGQWITELRQKFPVEVFQEQVETLYKK